MGTATAPVVSQYSLTNPPPGSSFEYAEVKTDRGKTSLGLIPILTWGEDDESIQHAIAFYSAKGISDILGGTSLRVSFQGIGRTAKEKAAANPNDAAKQQAASDEAIAAAQIAFRPGTREGGQSTPQSRAVSQARRVAQAVNPDVFAQLLKMVENKQIDPAVLKAAGLEGADELYTVPVAATNGEAEAETEEGTEQ